MVLVRLLPLLLATVGFDHVLADHLRYTTPVVTLAFIVDMSISVIVMHIL